MPSPDKRPGDPVIDAREGDPAQVSHDETIRLRDAGVAHWLVERVDVLARGDRDSIASVLTQLDTTTMLDGTRTSCRCHFLTLDGNKRPRVDALAQKVVRQVLDYCIPRSRVIEARRHFDDTGSAEAFSALDAEARGLFTKLERSGEGGELLLYMLLETVLRLPQLLCKMPLKTSSQMHVHGVDGIHGRVLPNGILALYWGESKLYARVNEAIDACFESITPYLMDDGSGVAARDLKLVRDHVDPGDEEVRRALVQYFDESQPESARIEFRGACLVGFNRDCYPDPHGDDGVTIRDEIASEVAKWNRRIATVSDTMASRPSS